MMEKISDFCAEWATPMSDTPPICESNGFTLQRKPNGGRITLNAASIWGISVNWPITVRLPRAPVVSLPADHP
jgi:hypothetical protein